MSDDVRFPGDDETISRAGVAESVLAELDSADTDLPADEVRTLLESAVTELRPTPEFPGDPHELELLGDLYERLGLCTLDEGPEVAAGYLYRAAVVGLLRGDVDLRLRCVEITADLHRSVGNVRDAAADYRAVAAAYVDTDPDRAAALQREAETLDDGSLPSPEFIPEPEPAPEPAAEPPTEPVPEAAEEREPVDVLDPDLIREALATSVDPSGSDTGAHRAVAELHGDLVHAASGLGGAREKNAGLKMISDLFAEHWTAVADQAVDDISAGNPEDADWRFRHLIEAHGLPDGPSDELVGRSWLGRVQLCLPASPALRNVVVEAANYVTSLSAPRLRAKLAAELARSLFRVPGPERIRRQLLEGAEVDFRSIGNEPEVLRCQLAKAMDLAFAGSYREAHDMFTSIAARARQIRDLPLYADALLNLGRSWDFANRPAEAVECFDRVLRHFQVDNLRDAREAEGFGLLALERGKVMAKNNLPATEPGDTPTRYLQLAYDTFARFDLLDLAESARRELQG